MDELNNLTGQNNPEEQKNTVETEISEELNSLTGLENPEGTNSPDGSEEVINPDEPIVIPALPEPPKKTKSSTAGAIAGLLVMAIALAAFGFFGIRTLVRKSGMTTQDAERGFTLEAGKWTQFQAFYATDGAVYKHSVNFIPTAYEYYFYVFSKDGSSYAVVRADKKWCEKNFDENGVAIDKNGVTVTGYVRSADYKVKEEVSRQFEEAKGIVGRSFRGSPSLFVDTIATRLSIYEVVICFLPVVVFLILFLFCRKLLTQKIDSTAGKIILGGLLIGCIVYAGFVIHVLAIAL